MIKPLRLQHLVASFSRALALTLLSSAWLIALPAQASPQSDFARSQREFKLMTYLSDRLRVQRILYPLLNNAAIYCEDKRTFSLGIPPLSVQDLPKELQDAYEDVAGKDLAHQLRFTYIFRATPTEFAGVHANDILNSLTEVVTGRQIKPAWALVRSRENFVANSQLKLDLERDGKPTSLSLTPALICDLTPQIVLNEVPQIEIRGKQIRLSTGLLRLLPNDDELALVIANRVAHWLLNSSVRASDYAAERQADYLSAYLTAAAEFNVKRGYDAWLRLQSKEFNPRRALISKQPLTPERARELLAVIKEIQTKQSEAKRILPNVDNLSPKIRVVLTPTTRAEQGQSPLSPLPDPIDPRLTHLEEVPLTNAEGLAGYRRFLQTPLRPRAFAIGVGENGRTFWSYKVGANAAADAIDYCRLLAKASCYLYAFDNKVAWNPETSLAQPHTNDPNLESSALRVPEASGFANISDLNAVPLPSDKLVYYRAFLEKPSPRALVITEGGNARYWLGPAALNNALAFCERSSAPCWLYAVNDNVVWQKDPASRISQRAQLTQQSAESNFLGN